MNKKVSTLLTVALTLGGSLLTSSAFAQTFAEEMTKDGTSTSMYHVYVNAGGPVVEGSGLLSPDGNFYVESSEANKKNPKYMWSITRSTVNGSTYYTLKNAEGTAFPAVEVNGKKYTAFVQETYTDYEDELTYATDGTGSIDTYVGFSVADGKITTVNTFANAWNYKLVEVEAGEVADEELNSFFNKKGFNLAVKYDSKLGKLAENIFGGDSRVYAFEINEASSGAAWDSDEKAYKISASAANGKDLYVPAGMYFFTNRVLKDASKDVTADNIDWLASEFITVSPRETVETTVENRGAGQGFKLVPVKGSEFIYGNNTSEFKVADTPIWNACFSVSDNYSGYPYAINLNNFYYQKSAKDAATAKLEKASVGLAVLAFDADDTQYLTSKPDVTEYIFKFSDSALKDGKELLKTTKEAAVYNLQFVAGKTEAQQKLVGKYLTIASDGTSFEWVAKPYDITKVEHPAFQYTITNVVDEDKTDDVEKYTIITFTNRETNEPFTAKLFPETSYGENCYSLAFVDENTDIDEVTSLKVNSNNYSVLEEAVAKFNEDVIVKLIPATVDEYAGFVNVEDGTVRTIRFARDKYDTSNQWYTNVEKDGVGYKLSDKFVEENYDAAQFVLVKSEKPSTIARTFVYNNTTTEDVDDVPNGDKLSAYTYQLMYVADGTTSEYGLKGDGSNTVLALTNTANDIVKYFIRENADGSVSFFDSWTGTFSGMKVTDATECNSVQVEFDGTDKVNYVEKGDFTEIYKSTFSDTEIRTYLEGEAPVFSWAAENGHVTLRNNTTGVTGNYISMNDSREGILVSNDADAFYLHATDEKAVVPSFFISKGKGEGSNAASERMFMFNPTDSVAYPINMDYDPNYQLAKQKTKAIFKAGTLNEDYTKLNTWIKGENRDVAKEADNNGVWGGLDRFKFQIVETADHDGNYNVRQTNTPDGTFYLASTNEKLYFTGDKALAMAINVESVEAPTSNESVSASEVAVVAQNGSVVVKNAAGKNVVVSTILGQVVANEVLTSDNATINVPAGIVVVAVEGESFKVNVK